MLDDLYSSKLLSLSANISHLGALDAAQGRSTKHARLCGSVVKAEIMVRDGVVADFAQDVKACALGQASAAVLGRGIIGASLEDVTMARDGLRVLLAGENVRFETRFADLVIFEGVRDYKARHASVMLAFEAASEALEQALAHSRTSTGGTANNDTVT
jgi:NifU-like protein involved in Fe-S cluster formation